MSDVAAAIRAKLDSMVEGSGNLQSCAGCEGDCYCQAYVDYQAAVLAVLELHTDGTGCPVCLAGTYMEEDGEGNGYEVLEKYWDKPCPTVRAVAAALGIEAG